MSIEYDNALCMWRAEYAPARGQILVRWFETYAAASEWLREVQL